MELAPNVLFLFLEGTSEIYKRKFGHRVYRIASDSEVFILTFSAVFRNDDSFLIGASIKEGNFYGKAAFWGDRS